MKRLLLLFVLAILTLSLNACGDYSDTASEIPTEEAMPSGVDPTESERDTPETDPLADNSDPISSDNPTPISDELPSGYLESSETIFYQIYDQLGKPGDIITEVETDYATCTYFIPDSPEISQLMAEYNAKYICSHISLDTFESFALFVYPDFLEIYYIPSPGLLDARIHDVGAAMVTTHFFNGESIYSASINAVIDGQTQSFLSEYGSSTPIVEFDSSGPNLSDIQLDLLRQALDYCTQ